MERQVPRWTSGARFVAALALAAACREPPPDRSPPPAPEAVATPADSLVLELEGDVKIWFAEGREARDSAGAPCVERSVEIRRRDSTIKVPLLYTGRAPAVVDQRTIRAELSKDCRVMAIYHVDLATGRPTKIADR